MDIRYDLNSKEAHQYTYTTLIALVDSIIPRTPLLAELYGEIMFYGALDLYTDEYIIMLLVNIEAYITDVNVSQQYPILLSILGSINRFTILGYYSEWFGYGTTRLEKPNRRVLQYYPLSWDQVGYPGPSLSYGSYVRQYYQTINKEREDSV